MKKILFVDHAFHSRTKSSQFFIDLLRTRFEVDILEVDPESREPIDFEVPDGTDIAVVWQMDYLAPFFLSEGLPTVVVPMYDGSGQMPLLHWHMLREARFVAFSFQLDCRLREAGCQTLLAKYFPEVPRQQTMDFTDLRAFLWQRNSADISWGLVNHIVGDQLASLHVHDAPDDPSKPRLPFEKMPYPITVSTWFEDREDLDEVLNSANVFIAPRSAEGIGMAFLEAMARGCCVLAHNLPTHNEYIAHGVNGLLFDRNRGDRLDLAKAKSMGAWARRTVADGRKQWVDVHCRKILDYIDAAERPSEEARRFGGAFVEDLVDNYVRGFDSYVAFLKRNVMLIYPTASKEADVAQHLKVPKGTEPLRFGRGGTGTAYQVAGFTEGSDVSWCCMQTAELAIPIRDRNPVLLAFDAFLPDDIPVDIRIDVYVNGQRMVRSSCSPADRQKKLYCLVPAEHRTSDVLQVKFLFDRLCVGNQGGGKATAIGLKALQVYGLDEIPLSALSDMERLSIGVLSDPRAARDYVIWCLKTGKSFYKDSSALEFSSENLVAIARRLVHDSDARSVDPETMAMIWERRDHVEHDVLGDLPIHVIHKEVIESREDVRQHYDVTTDVGVAAFIGWYYLHGISELELEEFLNPSEIDWLFARCSGLSSQMPLLRIAYCVWCMRNDLQKLFDVTTPEGREGMMTWLSHAGVAEIPALMKLAEKAKISRRGAVAL